MGLGGNNLNSNYTGPETLQIVLLGGWECVCRFPPRSVSFCEDRDCAVLLRIVHSFRYVSTTESASSLAISPRKSMMISFKRLAAHPGVCRVAGLCASRCGELGRGEPVRPIVLTFLAMLNTSRSGMMAAGSSSLMSSVAYSLGSSTQKKSRPGSSLSESRTFVDSLLCG